MTNSNDDEAPRPQAEVTGDLDGAGTLNGRAGASVFSIGGPDGRAAQRRGRTPTNC
jgi:putative redox protein